MAINKYYADEYDPTKSYSKNDRCVFNNEWYECLDNTTGEFDTTKWKKRYLVEYIGGGSSSGGSKILETAFIVRGGSSITTVLITKDGEEQYNYNGTSNTPRNELIGEYMKIKTNSTIEILKSCTIKEFAHWPNVNTVLTQEAGDIINITSNSYLFSVIE